MSNITGIIPSTKLDISNWKIPKDIKLADEQFNETGSIDLLTVADLFYVILRSGNRTLPGNYPVLQVTALGWTISGRTPTTTRTCDAQHTFLLREDNSLEHSLNHFWEVERLEHSTKTAEQQACEELDHRDPVNSQEGKKTCYCLPHPVAKEMGSTTRTQIASGGVAKSSNGTHQHN
jgi:hypothetical protein